MDPSQRLGRPHLRGDRWRQPGQAHPRGVGVRLRPGVGADRGPPHLVQPPSPHARRSTPHSLFSTHKQTAPAHTPTHRTSALDPSPCPRCNLPHEGLSDLDYLCEEGLVQLLKMASNLHTSITAYQVTDKGMHIVDRLSKVRPTSHPNLNPDLDPDPDPDRILP